MRFPAIAGELLAIEYPCAAGVAGFVFQHRCPKVLLDLEFATGRRWREAFGAHRLAEVHAFDVFHEQIEEVAALPVLEDGDDIRMAEFPEHACLAGEAFRKGRIAPELRREDLQRDRAIEARLPRLIDKAHAALTDEPEHFELRKSGADFRERRRGASDGLGFLSIAEHARRTQAARRVGRDGRLALGTDFRVHADS
jgi:hypothetical protein